MQFKQAGINVKSPMALAAMMMCSLLAGYLLFLLVETPFMRLRDKYFSHTNKTSPEKFLASNNVNLS